MQVSVAWLKEWVDVDVSDDAAVKALAHRLTMAGLEVEANEPAAPPATGVVVAEVLAIERHPNAEKLAVCRVNTGGEQLQIVCGAPNVRVGMRAPLAQVGARLPNDVVIKRATLRGIESCGMLCSAAELGLAEASSGLLELPQDAPVGLNLVEALQLSDRVLTFNLTPNRGDCMSVLGIAREVAAIAGKKLKQIAIEPIQAASKDTLKIQLITPEGASKFAGRIIRGVRPNAPTPLWMRERLRRAGVRSISAIVDVTNYLMLEYGQPMHAYDLSKIDGAVSARWAKAGEKLTLLDGREILLAPDVMVIADEKKVLGLAGIMGGQASSIQNETTDLFLEVAHFAPSAIAGRGRRYGLITDASQRFERGVDPQLPEQVIERATLLILEIAGGTPGPTVTVGAERPQLAPIFLRAERVQRLLGVVIDRSIIYNYLISIGMNTVERSSGWDVTPPSWRFDIRIEEDLIEEIARLYGYDRLPATESVGPQALAPWPETRIRNERIADLLADRGYQEAVTYSFTNALQQAALFPSVRGLALANPISEDLAVMRVSLWPGLAMAARENQRRQQDRVRLFEIGRKYVDGAEIEVVAGVAVGSALPEQWSLPHTELDFFDVKGDVEALLRLTGDADSFHFEASAGVEALHPGQAARITRNGISIGWIGALHPQVAASLDLTYPIFVFELETQPAFHASIPRFVDISMYPAIRRDLAVIVDENITASALEAAVRATVGPLLSELRLLSVYRGQQVGIGKKSIALALKLQDTLRTLIDADAEQIMNRVMDQLRRQFDAVIRDK